ncbi:hypothetical protein JCM11491_002700 [Sporobolomyces phaffii]
MPPLCLPLELVASVFANVTAPSDLAHLARASKTLSAIAKPLLYSHIRINSEHRRFGLAKIDPRDARRVERVSVVGNSRVWDHEVHELGTLFAEHDLHVGDEGACPLGSGGCIRDLVEGRLFDVGGKFSPSLRWIERVESLVVRNIFEDPDCEILNPPAVAASYAANNLRSLSILSHRGSARLWSSILTKENLPSLKQLVLYEVTTYLPARSAPPRQSPQVGETILSSFRRPSSILYSSTPSGLPLALPSGLPAESDGGEPEEHQLVETILRDCSDLLDQLDLVVSPEFPFLLDRSFTHLALLSADTELNHSTKYALAHVGDNIFSDATDSILEQLWWILEPGEPKASLEYLSLGGWAEYCEDAEENVLEALTALGVKVVLEDSTEVVPQSFFDFLAEKEQEKKKTRGEHE